MMFSMRFFLVFLVPVALLLFCGKVVVDANVTQTTPINTSAFTPSSYYSSNCSNCHGPNGIGGNGGSSLINSAQSLIVSKISVGGSMRALVPNLSSLSNDNLTALAQYVANFESSVPFITINSNTPLAASSTETSISVLVSSNIAWVATSSTSFCTVPVYSAGRTSYTVMLQQNTDQSVRSCNIVFRGTGSNSSVATQFDINQAGLGPSIIVSGVSINANASSVSTLIEVKSTISWTALSDAPSWCTAPTYVAGTISYNATLVANNTNNTRVCRITFTGTSPNTNIIATYTINQATQSALVFTSASSSGINPNQNIGGWFRCNYHNNPPGSYSVGQNDFPQVMWSSTPGGTQSFVYIIEDTYGSGWVHLNLYNIPANLSDLSKLTPSGYQFGHISGSSVGNNSWSTSSSTSSGSILDSAAQIRPSSSAGATTGFSVLCPQHNTGVHTYTFKLYAMNKTLSSGSVNNLKTSEFEATNSSSIISSSSFSAYVDTGRVAVQPNTMSITSGAQSVSVQVTNTKLPTSDQKILNDNNNSTSISWTATSNNQAWCPAPTYVAGANSYTISVLANNSGFSRTCSITFTGFVANNSLTDRLTITQAP